MACASQTRSPTTWGFPPPEGARVHLVGMGGCGMRSLAELLRQAGCLVVGSEADTQRAGELRHRGFSVRVGHDAEHVKADTQCVVYSVAVDRRHPECQRAHRMGIPLFSYPEAIGQLLQRYPVSVAIAGTHGKSTTTALVAELLQAARLDPTVIVGAGYPGQGGLGCWGRGSIAVAEACEYQRSFLMLRPTTAVLTGIEADHFDCYHTVSQLEEAFAAFAERVGSDGLILVRADCPASQRAIRNSTARVKTFGVEQPADWRAVSRGHVKGCYRFQAFYRETHFADISLGMCGRHQMQNALAALAVAAELGVPAGVIRETLGRFAGLARRLQQVANVNGRIMIDDYAHHPSAVAAGLTALREAHCGRLYCVFQPHQLSRTRCLVDELARSLKNADRTWITEVYRVREQAGDQTFREARALAEELAEQVNRLGGNAEVVWNHATIVERLVAETNTGDVIVTMGAGNIKEVCDGLVDRLRRDCAA